MANDLSPLVRIYDYKDNEISHKVEKFRYVSAEEEDDLCEITLSSDDQNLPDDPGLQESRALKLVWGYINGEISDKRKVYIQDVIVNFGPEGVIMTLMCHDKYSTVKYNSSQRTIGDTNLLDELSVMANANGLGLELEDGAGGELIVIGNNKPLTQDAKTGRLIAEIDNARVFRQMEGIVYGGRSEFQVLREQARREPGGPWYLDGTDDKVTLKKRNFNKAPLRAYTYKGEDGHLLEFTPESKNKNKGGSDVNITIGGWDPERGNYHNTQLSGIAAGTNSLNFDNLVEGMEGNGDIQQINELFKQRQGISGRLGNQVKQAPTGRRPPIVIGGTTGDIDIAQGKILDEWGETPYFNEDGKKNVLPGGYVFSHVEAWGENSPQKQDPTTGRLIAEIDNARVVGSVAFYKPVEDVPKEDLSTYPDLGDGLSEGFNNLMQNELEANPATVEVIGNPLILKGVILTILNVSKKYSGNYYVIKAEHMPYFESGYRTVCDLVRASQNNIGSGGSPNTLTIDEATDIVTENGQKQTNPVKVNKEIGPSKKEDQKNKTFLLDTIIANQS